MNLVFVTDGSRAHAGGIAVVLHGLAAVGQPVESVTVACPAHSRPILGVWLAATGMLPMTTFVDATTDPEDPYRVQIGAALAVAGLGEQLFLALDYDHLVLGPLHLDPLVAGLTVSSEVHSAVNLLGWDDVTTGQIGPPPRHINSSLLYGRANLLHGLAQLWERHWRRLRAYVGPRYRVELALALAAEQHGVPTKAAPTSLQGSFHRSSRAPSVFHYGGESADARRMKDLLRMATASKTAVTPEDVSDLADQLEAMLTRLASDTEDK